MDSGDEGKARNSPFCKANEEPPVARQTREMGLNAVTHERVWHAFDGGPLTEEVLGEFRIFFDGEQGMLNCDRHPKPAWRRANRLLKEVADLRAALEQIHGLSFEREDDGRTTWRDLCLEQIGIAAKALNK
jgi:hypothetical protein